MHLSADGAELWWGEEEATDPTCVAVNEADGSCWVGDAVYSGGAVVHLAEDGAVLFRHWEDVGSVSVNPVDRACWVAHTGGTAKHLAEDGTDLWHGYDSYNHVARMPGPRASASVNPSDGSCWVADDQGAQTYHLADDGTELWYRTGYGIPEVVAANPTDGSCWMADARYNQRALVHLAEDGGQLWRGTRFTDIISLSVNPTDSSCWVADAPVQVAHYAGDGTKVWRSWDWLEPAVVSADQRDGSCWLAVWGVFEEPEDDVVVHLAEDGSELARVGIPYPIALAASPFDGSCWVLSGAEGLLRLGPDGGELWRNEEFRTYVAISANSRDGSCWVGGRASLVRLAADGTELGRGAALTYLRNISVNSADGSCWVASSTGVVAHFAEDGTELWRGQVFDEARSVSANQTDGSCWAAGDTAVVHLVLAPPLFGDVPYYFWARRDIEACAAAGVVAGYEDGLFRPEMPVTRDQMAAFISRALAGADDLVPPGPAEATFEDVPADHWAYRYIEYAHAQGIAEGFRSPSRYEPGAMVNRGMMAVFVARSVVDPTGEEGLANYSPPETPTFPDVTPTPQWEWCYKHVEYLAQEGIVKGYPSGLYEPALPVNRAQMAAYICRAFELEG